MKFRRNSTEKKEVDTELTELLEETAIVVTGGSFRTHKWSKASAAPSSGPDSDEKAGEKDDVNHNHQSKGITMGFLSIHENQENNPSGVGEQFSPERSPVSKHRPMIPPLDLSILHENVDGSGECTPVCFVSIPGEVLTGRPPLFWRLFSVVVWCETLLMDVCVFFFPVNEALLKDQPLFWVHLCFFSFFFF